MWILCVLYVPSFVINEKMINIENLKKKTKTMWIIIYTVLVFFKKMWVPKINPPLMLLSFLVWRFKYESTSSMLSPDPAPLQRRWWGGQGSHHVCQLVCWSSMHWWGYCGPILQPNEGIYRESWHVYAGIEVNTVH